MIPWEKDMLPAWPIRRIFMELLVLVDNNTYIDVDAAGEPGRQLCAGRRGAAHPL